ncbi:MAG: hypothetical protein H6650_11780 [Ardenticatenales bacterium]|nr:hypothetical protein [Ardenticatenales bacterium]
MSLLQLELNRLNAQFDRQWLAWQNKNGIAPTYTTETSERVRSDNLWNFFPLNLYEYFADVSFHTARQIALAARATGMYGFVRQQQKWGPWSTEQVHAGAAWLEAFARAQLLPFIDAAAPFWSQFDASLVECRHGFEQEREWLQLPAAAYPLPALNHIIAGKTAPARIITTAFATVAARPDVGEAVRHSQRHLYIGISLFQSVLNWKEDYRHGVFSYPLINLLTETPQLAATDPAAREALLTSVGRHFYYTGRAGQTLEEASAHIYRAMAAVSDLSPTLWGALLTRFLEQSESLRRDIAEIVMKGRRAAAASHPHTASPEKNTAPAEDKALHHAITNAAAYLAQNQAGDGRWGDFMLLAEQSTFWVTGYVGWTLSQLDKPVGRLPQAAHWLIQNQFDGGGWGYNRNWPLDADSIANVLLFLSTQADMAPDVWQPALHVLLAHQSDDGGFSTIIDAEAWLVRFRAQMEELSGWTHSHACVTGVIGLLLASLSARHAGDAIRPHAERVLTYLRRQQHADGFWHAYWWSGRLYATCRALQTMKAMGDPRDEQALARAAAWLARSQCADGSWGANGKQTGAPFHTAFAAQALAVSAQTKEEEAALNAGIHYLINHQRPDGSWSVLPVLRVPAPNVRRPWQQEHWTESTIGLNVIVPDWRRLFTTATALQALLALRRRR